MTAFYSFFEYTTGVKNLESLEAQLALLGYVKRTQHIENPVAIWSQARSLIMVNAKPRGGAGHVSGLGFLASDSLIASLGAKYDKYTDGYVAKDPNGLRIILMPDDKNASNTLVKKYKLIDINENTSSTGILSTGALVYNDFRDELIDFYERLGFRVVHEDEHFVTMVTQNNHVNLLFNKHAADGKIPTVILDTDDVFATTARWLVNEIDLDDQPYQEDISEFGSLSHKILSYECSVEGSLKSHTIEKLAPQALPNTDLIARTKNKFRNSSTHILRHNYGLY